jgi:hypothetical protein
MPMETELVEGAHSARLSWGAIFGGTFTALGFWILLAAFGLAVGLSAVSPADANLKGVAIWLGLWTLIVPILALFAGTVVGTRSAVTMTKVTGLLYGVVIWAFTTVIATIFAMMIMGSVVGKTLSTTASVVGTAGSAAARVAQNVGGGGGQAVQSIGSFLGIDRSDLRQGVNRQLAQRGLPPISPEQFQAALQDAATTAVRTGDMSEETLVGAFARHTPLSRDDARQVTAQIQQQWNQTMGAASAQLGKATDSARNAALSAVDMVGKSFWLVFGSVLLGLGASLAAGWLAARRDPLLAPDERGRIARLEGTPQPA